MKYELKDWLNSINHKKNNLMEDAPSSIKEYEPFIINRILSGSIDTILYANEMNMNSHLSKDMQYQFYLNCIRKRKRFNAWIKKEKIEDIEYIKKYYGYSNKKAIQVLKLLNKDQINHIKNSFKVGGME